MTAEHIQVPDACQERALLFNGSFLSTYISTASFRCMSLPCALYPMFTFWNNSIIFCFTLTVQEMLPVQMMSLSLIQLQNCLINSPQFDSPYFRHSLSSLNWTQVISRIHTPLMSNDFCVGSVFFFDQTQIFTWVDSNDHKNVTLFRSNVLQNTRYFYFRVDNFL